jgi:hypothetical protein
MAPTGRQCLDPTYRKALAPVVAEGIGIDGAIAVESAAGDRGGVSAVGGLSHVLQANKESSMDKVSSHMSHMDKV